MAVTNTQLAERIDTLTKEFRGFREEVMATNEAVNGRQRDLIRRVTTLEAESGMAAQSSSSADNRQRESADKMRLAQADLNKRMYALEAPLDGHNKSRLEDPKVLLGLVAIIQGLVGVVTILVQLL